MADGISVSPYICLAESSLAATMRTLNVVRLISKLPRAALGSVRRTAVEEASREPVAHSVALLREGLRLDYKLVVGQGDFRMAASSGIVFAEALLGRDGRVSAQPGAVAQRTVEARTRGAERWVDATMDQGVPMLGPAITGELAEAYRHALNLTHGHLHPGLPIQVASTGLPYLIVPVQSGLDSARISHPAFEGLLEASGAAVRLPGAGGSVGGMGAQEHMAAPGQPGDPATLTSRLFRDMAGALELLTVYLGERLGLYQALYADGSATSAELAARTGTSERYIREWLEHHAAGGLLEVDDPAAEPLARRYTLPPGHVPVLADTGDVRYQGFNGVEIVRAARWIPEVAEAIRSGGAPLPLPWAPEGRPEFNRAVFLNLLAKQWLPAIPDVDLRLRVEPPARVADLACGTGWSSIAMAQAYPLISVDGFDLDADAIQAARRNAEEAGLADRVTFAIADASGSGVCGQYDLVTIFEGLHDISRPVDALRLARGMLREPGCVIVADELVEDEFTAPASAEEQYHYAWSVVACLPAVMGDPDTAATGAVMRPATLRRYALEAGFRDLEVLPVKAEMLRFYRLTP
jgi:2-polyprenyl-3-methyl-5-hydroxy-6-metoxy-1,4-benzoquinol methylase